MAGVAGMLYNTLFKRTSTFVLTVMVGSFFFERAYDSATDMVFDSINEGKLWKHIKGKYETE